MPLRRFLAIAVFGFIVCANSWAAHVPRLVVIVIADQMRADYLTRFKTDFSSDGFERMEREGVYFPTAAYDYGATKTGPGHALVGSGTYPFQNGIVGNEWYDRSSNQTVACGDLAPSADGRTTLKWFVGKSFAQRFHAVYPKGRIFGVSHKARAALLLGGPGQDNAFWWDNKRKEYRAFGEDPAWLTAARKDFPVPGKGNENVDASIAALASALVDGEHLGANPTGVPDVLTVSFSEIDYVGHEHGPDAPETRMAVVRLDRLVGTLMRTLESRVSRKDMFWVLTADHGVTPVPEETRKKGLRAGRVSMPLMWRAGLGLVKAISLPYIYVDEAAAKKRGLSKEQAEELLVDEAAKIEGVQSVFTESDILLGHAPEDLRRSIYPGRSGDLYIVLKPNYIFSEHGSGTTHGQPTQDDQRVPLLFWGGDLKAHVDARLVSPIYIAPTVLNLLNISAPDLHKPLNLQSHD